MTKQEADFIGSMNMCDEISNEAYKKIMCHCEVEEQQPCEDCISRQTVINAIANTCFWLSADNWEDLIKCINSISPIIPAEKQEPCENCISRAEVLDIINFEDEWLFDANSHNADTKIAFSTIKSKISEMPSVTPKARWIPVTERLPEDGRTVLVWYEYFRYGDYNKLFQIYGLSYAYGGHWSEFVNGESGWKDLRIIAWMPLPEPYKAESEGEE